VMSISLSNGWIAMCMVGLLWLKRGFLGAKMREGREPGGLAAFSKTLLELLKSSAWSSDTAQPIVVADATAESGAAVGPGENHGMRPYSEMVGGVKRVPTGLDHALE
jgi:hypothetical protein